ncbi:MAG: SPOR domain-containing protein [Gammaproteobacteria bacterium]|nr:SPOR domain-containing protein [Gammaproteobacteria bacterium]
MKERLTGAIILVALIVLLVPELLSGPVRSAPRAAIAPSSAEEPPLRSYTIKLADEPRARDDSTRNGPDQPAPLPAAPAAAAAAASPPPAPAATQEPPSGSAAPRATPPAAHPAPSVTAARKGSTGTAESSGTYLVQLGSFASRANAERLSKKVRAQGFVVSVSQGSPGGHYRVRVGPAQDHADASELAQQLRAHGHSGTIVSQ